MSSSPTKKAATQLAISSSMAKMANAHDAIDCEIAKREEKAAQKKMRVEAMVTVGVVN